MVYAAPVVTHWTCTLVPCATKVPPPAAQFAAVSGADVPLVGHSQVPGLAVPLCTSQVLRGAVLPVAETAVRWPRSSTTVTVMQMDWSYPLPVVTDPPPAPKVP